MTKKDKTQKQDRAALETSQTSEIAWYGTQWQEHPVVGLTPAKLHQLHLRAEQGDLAALADLGADMEERDGHIFSELSKRKDAIKKRTWLIIPPKNASDPEKKIATEIFEWLDDIEDFEMFLFDALDAIGHGYSCQEIKWHRMGNLWLPKSFEHHLAREFMTPQHNRNELRLNDSSMDGAAFWDFGWIVHQHKAKSGYIARTGLHRVLSWPFLFKNYGVRDIMEFLEIYGLPIRLGQYPEGATDAEKMTLLRAVMSIGRNAGGIIPKGMQIDFKNAATGDTNNHMSLIKWCEQTQSKIIVGGTLLSQADGKTSTNAQSNTHENMFEDIVKSDAKQLARSLNDSLIAYLMRLNYPNVTQDRYPKFKFDDSETEDLKLFSESLDSLVDNGMQIPLRWAHERTGIPMPEDNEPILTKQSNASPTQNLAANTYQPSVVGQHIAANNVQVLSEDAAMSAQLQDEVQGAEAISNAWLTDLVTKLRAGENEEKILAILSELNPHDDEPALQDKLSQIIFAADVFGRLSAQSEI